jgi:periplasmic protein TonB
MQGQGFLAKPNHSPASFGLAFTITGAGLAALLLASPYVRTTIAATVIEAVNVPVELPPVPPPPVPPKADPQRKVATDPQRFTPPPAPPNGSKAVTGTEGGEIVTGTGTGEIFRPGPIAIPEVPPVPVPVITDARYDMRYAASQQPPYPAAQQREEIEGSVTVRVRIGIDGRVLAVEEVRASNPAFFATTRDWALRKWRFKPAMRDGVAIESWRTMSVKFTIAR